MSPGERAPDDGGHGWLRRDVRAAPAAVWALLLLHLLVLGAWTVLQPPYRGLDEAAHADMVVALPPPLAWPGPGEKLYGVGPHGVGTPGEGVLGTLDEAADDGGGLRLTAEQTLPRNQRPSFDEAGRSPDGLRVNQMIQHPPLYYVYAAAGLRLWPGSDALAYDLQLTILRGLSLLLVAPLPLLCWLSARRLHLSATAGVAAAVVPLTIPALTRVSASISNDTLLILTTGVATVLALAVAGGDLRRKTALTLGVTAAAAMYTKGFGLVLPALIGSCYGVAALRGAPLRRIAVPASLSLLVSVGLAGGWYVRNVVRSGSVQPNGYPGGGLPFPERQGGGVLEWAPRFVEAVAFRFWGSLGEPEPPALPYTLCLVLTALVLVLCLVAFVVARHDRSLVVLALLPTVLLYVLVAYGSYGIFQTYDRFLGAQGRYLFPAVTGLAAVIVLALDRLLGRARHLLPLVLLSGAAAMQLLALAAVLSTYWSSASGITLYTNGFDVMQTWAALPALAVQALFAVTAAAAVGAVLATAAASRRPPADPEEALEEREQCVDAEAHVTGRR